MMTDDSTPLKIFYLLMKTSQNFYLGKYSMKWQKGKAAISTFSVFTMKKNKQKGQQMKINLPVED